MADRGDFIMKKNHAKTKIIILTAMFISIQIVMTLIPFLGFIPMGFVNLTTLHIPTILAGILLGVKGGAVVGLSFGIMSVVNATINPGLLSFMFSPFAPAPVGFSANPFSLVVAIVPRILLGVLSAFIYKFIEDKNWQFTLSRNKGMKIGAATIAALISSFLHTAMVLSLWILFFADQLISVLGLNGFRGVLIFTGGIITSNALFEAALAGILMTGFVAALEPLVKKMVK